MARVLSSTADQNFAANISGQASLSRDMAWGDGDATNTAPFIPPNDSTIDQLVVSSSTSFGSWIARVLRNRVASKKDVIMAASSNQLTAIAHGLSVDDTFEILGDGTPSAPLQKGITYFVESVVSTDAITVKATTGGSAIDLTTDSTGALELVPQTVYDVQMGQPDAVVNSMTASSDEVSITGHGLVVGDRFQITGTGTIAAPMEKDRTYFVQSVVDANTITVTETAGGALLDLTADSSGSLTLLYDNGTTKIDNPQIAVLAGDNVRLRFIKNGVTISDPQIELHAA